MHVCQGCRLPFQLRNKFSENKKPNNIKKPCTCSIISSSMCHVPSQLLLHAKDVADFTVQFTFRHWATSWRMKNVSCIYIYKQICSAWDWFFPVPTVTSTLSTSRLYNPSPLPQTQIRSTHPIRVLNSIPSPTHFENIRKIIIIKKKNHCNTNSKFSSRK